MVGANGANTNTKSRPSSFRPQARESRFNAPFPAAGGGMGCPLAQGPAEGTRAGLVGAARASPARIPGRRRDAAHTHNEDADRLSAKTGEPRGRESAAEGVNHQPRQGPRAKISGADK